MEIWLPDTSILSGEWFLALSLLWLLGYCLVLTRMWLGWRQLQTWRQQAKKSSPPQEWAAFLDRARHQLGIQRTPLFGTLEDIPSPLTFGWWKPVILLPVGLINQLTPQEVEAILWHELSHVRRQDYLWQTLQLLLTRFFYYHPLIWWLDRFLVDEREMATDQLALTWAPDRTGYARALVHATEWGMRQEQLSLAARGRPGQLTHRIQQILNRNSTKTKMTMKKPLWILPLLGLPLLAILFTAWTPDHPEQSLDLTGITVQDTVKPEIKTFQKVSRQSDQGQEELHFIDGNLDSLIINGKAIAPEDFPKYQDLIEEVQSDLPEPPPVPDTPENRKIRIRKTGDPKPDQEKEIEVIIIQDDDRQETIRHSIEGDLEMEMDQVIRVETRDEDDVIVITREWDGKKEEIVVPYDESTEDIEWIDESEEVIIIEGDDSGEEQVIRIEKQREHPVYRQKQVEIRSRAAEKRARERSRVAREREQVAREREREMRHHILKIEREHLENEKMSSLIWKPKSWLDQLGHTLHQQGLINDPAVYQIDLNTKRCKVNGKKVSTEDHQVILEAYHDMTGLRMSDDDRIKLDVDNR